MARDLEVRHFPGEQEHFLGSTNVYVDGDSEFLVKANCRCTVKNHMRTFQQFPVLRRQTNTYFLHPALDHHHFARVIWLLFLQPSVQLRENINRTRLRRFENLHSSSVGKKNLIPVFVTDWAKIITLFPCNPGEKQPIINRLSISTYALLQYGFIRIYQVISLITSSQRTITSGGVIAMDYDMMILQREKCCYFKTVRKSSISYMRGNPM